MVKAGANREIADVCKVSTSTVSKSLEMKKRGENLQKHYRQAFDYWTRLVPNRPRYVVLCNFDEFRVYDFDTDLDAPKDTVALKDLPERWGPLAFLGSRGDQMNADEGQSYGLTPLITVSLGASGLHQPYKTVFEKDA